MKFLVIGGTGDMGRRIVTELVVADGVGLVTFTGRNAAKGQRVLAAAKAAQRAAGLPTDAGARVQMARLDVGDTAATGAHITDHDVVVGAMGPFYLYEEPLVRAVIKARRSYVSLCDDADAIQAVLGLDRAAQAADVSILTGMGWTPGLTSLVARHAADQLDGPYDIHMAWVGSTPPNCGRAVALHTLHSFSATTTTIIDGTSRRLQAGTDPERLVFPAPVGPITVRHCAHPEMVTLPLYMPNLRSATLKGGLPEPILNWLGPILGRVGLTTTHGRRAALWPILKVAIEYLRRIGARPGGESALLVKVTGQRDGGPATITGTAIGPMADLTSVPAAVAALWLAEGRISRRGVFPPEAPGGPDPVTFLAEMARRGIPIAWQGL